MLPDAVLTRDHVAPAVNPSAPAWMASGLQQALQGRLDLRRRRLKARMHLYRTGQPMRSVYLVHAGSFKTCLVSEDGREKVTGFRSRGGVLGLDSMGMAHHASDAVALDTAEVWCIPLAGDFAPQQELRDFHDRLMAMMAAEIREQSLWMLNIGTLSAEQRVAAFLLEHARQLDPHDLCGKYLRLCMTRADLGSFLALQLETVARSLSLLAARGLIRVERRHVWLLEPDVLYRFVYRTRLH